MTQVKEITSEEAAILAVSKDDESLVSLRDYRPMLEKNRIQRAPAIFIADWDMFYDLMGVEA